MIERSAAGSAARRRKFHTAIERSMNKRALIGQNDGDVAAFGLPQRSAQSDERAVPRQFGIAAKSPFSFCIPAAD
jgi:hypothetical protein